MKAALLEFGKHAPMFKGTKLNFGAVFHIRNATSKDADNMHKCLLQDVLEGAVCNNNKLIFSLNMLKGKDPLVPKTA
jgi:hypothetical protein